MNVIFRQTKKWKNFDTSSPSSEQLHHKLHTLFLSFTVWKASCSSCPVRGFAFFKGSNPLVTEKVLKIMLNLWTTHLYHRLIWAHTYTHLKPYPPVGKVMKRHLLVHLLHMNTEGRQLKVSAQEWSWRALGCTSCFNTVKLPWKHSIQDIFSEEAQ